MTYWTFSARWSNGFASKLASIARALWSSSAFLWAVVIVVYALAIGHAVIKVCRPDDLLGNFYTFRNAAIALSNGRDLYAGQSNEYVYPPLIAFLYQPFSRISLHAAGVISLIINSLLALTTVWMATTEMSRRLVNTTDRLVAARVAVIATVLTSSKIHNEFNLWETNVLVLLMCTIALVFSDRRQWIAGAALGFAFNIKYLPLTLIPYLMLRRRWGVVGGFAASALIFAMLPAISLEWVGNLHALGEAYGGLAGLFKISVPHAAHLGSLTDSRTLSVTSGIARMSGWAEAYVVVVAAMLLLVFASSAALASERYRLPPLNWPVSSQQTGPRHRAMFAIEWVVVMMLTLVFSPFTNSAHLYLLLLANAAGAALLISPRFRSSRGPLIIGMAVMYIGNTLPPASDRFRAAENLSKWVGLPLWCVLVNAATLFWSGLQMHEDEQSRAPRPAPVSTIPALAVSLDENAK